MKGSQQYILDDDDGDYDGGKNGTNIDHDSSTIFFTLLPVHRLNNSDPLVPT